MKFCNRMRAVLPAQRFFFQIRFRVLRNSPLAQGSCQVTPSENAADPPDLKTAKDQGDQTQLDVSPVQVVHQDHFSQRH